MRHYYIIFIFLTAIVTGQSDKMAKLHINKILLDSLLAEGKEPYSNKQNTKEEGEYINFNPVMQFKNGKDYIDLLKDPGDLSQVTIFTIYLSDEVSMEKELWGIYDEESNITLTTSRIAYSDRELSFDGGSSQVPILNTYIQSYRSKNRNKVPGQPRALIGSFSGNAAKAFKGNIAEIIVFDRVLRGRNRQLFESSLALKYGITLDNNKDYLSSAKEDIYSLKNNAGYTDRISGIGKDDVTGLNQKQSRSTEEGSILTISLGRLAKSNPENKEELPNETFLVWGDNDAEPVFPGGEEANSPTTFIGRHWKMQSTGSYSSELKTTVTLDISNVFKEIEERPVSDYLLVIDTSGEGTFDPENTIYNKAAALENNRLVFEEIQWDQDNSGSDVFSFTLREDLQVTLSEGGAISCDHGRDGKLRFTVHGGIPPYHYELLTSDSTIIAWNSTDDKFPEQLIGALSEAEYTFKVTDALATQKEDHYGLEAPIPIMVDLGEDRKIQFDAEEITLEAMVTSEDEISYEWSSDHGFISNQPAITVTSPGVYTVNVRSANGCKASDSIVVEPGSIRLFRLFPNQSKDGNYQIQVELNDIQDIAVHVFDLTGRLIYTMSANNQSSYQLNGIPLLSSGIYNVVLQSAEIKVSRILAVE